METRSSIMNWTLSSREKSTCLVAQNGEFRYLKIAKQLSPLTLVSCALESQLRAISGESDSSLKSLGGEKMILITGATGNNGAELIKRLSANGTAVRAFVRDKRKAHMIALPGVEIVEGDFSKPETFTPALTGVDRLFLLIPSSADVEAQQRNFADAAKHNGVKHIVKLSQLGADVHSSGRFQRYHGAVEEHIRNSGMNYTFLRPNLFMQGLLNFRSTISAQGVFYVAAGKAKVSIVDVRDIAAVAARVLTERGHEGEIYDITGPESLTHAEMADLLSEAAGRSVKYVDISPDSMRQGLLGIGMPVWQADGLVEDYEIYRRGEAGNITSTVQEVTGNAPTRFVQFARDYAREFRGQTAKAVHR
jgi:uncharacterized protein YbjT (DUF2867 family)